MKKSFVVLALLPLTMSLAMSGVARGEELYLLKPNYIWCREQKDIVDLADTVDEKQWQDKLSKKMYQGDCAVMPAMVQVGRPEEKKTPKGNAYVCFKLIDPTIGTIPDIECTFPKFVTTLKSEIRSRSGNYRLLISNEVVKLAECAEGGRVTLSKEKGGWVRISMIFPIELKNLKTTAEKDNFSALRDGCKGADYLNDKS